MYHKTVILHSMSHAPSLLFPSHVSSTSLSTCTPVRPSVRPFTLPSLLSNSHGDVPCEDPSNVSFGPLAEPRSTTQEAEAALRPEETQGMRLERQARDLAADWQRTRQLGQPLGEGGLSRGGNVEDMRNRLRALGALVWGTKAHKWPRLVHVEARRELQKRDEVMA